MRWFKMTCVSLGFSCLLASHALGQYWVRPAPEYGFSQGPDAYVARQEPTAPSPSDQAPPPAPTELPDAPSVRDILDKEATDAACCPTRGLDLCCEGDPWELFPESRCGVKVGGWFQAGNLGGGGLGGGLGLWLATRVPEPWMPSAIVGLLCLACAFALIAVPSPPPSQHATVMAGLRESVRDLWTVIRERSGLIALILCFLPIGSGAAGGLWSAVAVEWSASADTVALVTGTLGGIVSAVGCITGGWVCDRMDRKTAYVLYGLMQAACAIAMAMLPRSETYFIVLTTAYAFIAGLTYAGFTAFVLEVIGKGAAATKYSVYASLSNMPIWYMTNVDGWAHDRFSSSGMLFTEAALGVAGAAVFLVLVAVLRGRGRGKGDAGLLPAEG